MSEYQRSVEKDIKPAPGHIWRAPTQGEQRRRSMVGPLGRHRRLSLPLADKRPGHPRPRGGNGVAPAGCSRGTGQSSPGRKRLYRRGPPFCDGRCHHHLPARAFGPSRGRTYDPSNPSKSLCVRVTRAAPEPCPRPLTVHELDGSGARHQRNAGHRQRHYARPGAEAVVLPPLRDSAKGEDARPTSREDRRLHLVHRGGGHPGGIVRRACGQVQWSLCS
jgi:hypothetical protein